MSEVGIKISKDGFDVTQAENKDLSVSSQFDTFKIFQTGTLTLSLPSETVNSTSVIHTETLDHNLGYIPFTMPWCRGIAYTDSNGDDSAVDSTDDFIVNDKNEDQPVSPYSPPLINEKIYIYLTTTQYVLEVTRTNALPTDAPFGARDCIVYYTIFYNQMDTTFNLL